MRRLVRYNADQEEPSCMRCDNCTKEALCEERCGAPHGWALYKRTELEDED